MNRGLKAAERPSTVVEPKVTILRWSIIARKEQDSSRGKFQCVQFVENAADEDVLRPHGSGEVFIFFAPRRLIVVFSHVRPRHWILCIRSSKMACVRCCRRKVQEERIRFF